MRGASPGGGFGGLYGDFDFDLGMSDDRAGAEPDCFNPPTTAFGDSMTIGIDEATYPLANPHEQPAGDTLKRS